MQSFAIGQRAVAAEVKVYTTDGVVHSKFGRAGGRLAFREARATIDMVAANGVRLSSLTNCVSWECVRLQKIICADRRKVGVLVLALCLRCFH